MPTLAATVTIDGSSSLDPAPLVPQFGATDVLSDGGLWAMLGAGWRIAGVVMAPDGTLAAAGITLPAGIVEFAATSELLAAPPPRVRPTVRLSASLDGDAALALAMSMLAATSVAVLADSGLDVDVGPRLPIIRNPLPGESPGTANLVRNPSLEYAAFGLSDWSAQTGITLTRDNADAWDGSWSGLAAIVAGGGLPEVAVRSQQGVKDETGQPITGRERWWIGSASMSGAAPQVRVFLRLVYTDGTTSDGAPTDYVATTLWQRVVTETVVSNAAKTLARIDFIAAGQQQGGGGITFRLDGVQIEEAATGQETPYADGDQGDGFRWTSTAGLSMSVREPAA